MKKRCIFLNNQSTITLQNCTFYSTIKLSNSKNAEIGKVVGQSTTVPSLSIFLNSIECIIISVGKICDD